MGRVLKLPHQEELRWHLCREHVVILLPVCSATKDDNTHNFCPLMMDKKPEECSVCFNNYDDTLLRPRNLPCGHSFCTQCIDNAIKNDQLTCPSCRAQHAATAATQFPIGYGMEALIRKLKGIEVVPGKTVPAKPSKAPARGISKKLRSLVEKQKSSINSLITSCEKVLSQLSEYWVQLGDWKTHHLQLQDRLYALVEQNKSAMKLLELEDTSVVDMKTQGEEGKTRLQAILESLDTVNTAQQGDTTIAPADECSMKVEDWLQKCQERFPDVKTVHTSVKVQKTISKALEMTTTEMDATADPVHLEASASSIMNKVQEITGEIPQKKLTVSPLEQFLRDSSCSPQPAKVQPTDRRYTGEGELSDQSAPSIEPSHHHCGVQQYPSLTALSGNYGVVGIAANPSNLAAIGSNNPGGLVGVLTAATSLRPQQRRNIAHTCPICGHTVLCYSEFEQHVRTHALEKPFVCHLCSYQSALRNNLYVHLKFFHKLDPPPKISSC
ncbi:uncharacterized protein [Procambarus clarkii]|uniref:uncharacterized protein isoform X4 n=1 Tax=Procambarus clarkii TaxID=6728 RepID=UPI0037434A4E